MIRRFFPLFLVIGLAACAPTIANRGHIVEPDKLAEVKPGTSTREEVSQILGTPTQIGTFDENRWYYFGRSTKQYSFFEPEVIQQKAVEVRFNDEGVVTEVKELDPALAQDVSPVGRRTPTYGHETTILEQVVGNLGQRVGRAKDTKDKK